MRFLIASNESELREVATTVAIERALNLRKFRYQYVAAYVYNGELHEVGTSDDRIVIWLGETLSKKVSAAFDSERDYSGELTLPEIFERCGIERTNNH